PASKSLLQGLRALFKKHVKVSTTDVVMSGFRATTAGAEEFYGIEMDMAVAPKGEEGGMRVGEGGGKRESVEYMVQQRPVYQAGTLSGNPLDMAAGLAMLKAIQKPGFYDQLTARVQLLLNGLQAAADAHGIPFTHNSAGSMFGFFFTELKAVNTFRDVAD